VAIDEDIVLPQEDRPLGVKKQPEGIKAYISFTKYKPTLGQLSRTLLPQAVIKADQPQYTPIKVPLK